MERHEPTHPDASPSALRSLNAIGLLAAGVVVLLALAVLLAPSMPPTGVAAIDRHAIAQQAVVGAYYEQVDSWAMPEAVTSTLPVDVALGRDDQVYVADWWSRSVHLLDGGGNTLAQISMGGLPPPRVEDEAAWPLAVDVDLDRQRVHVLWTQPGNRQSRVTTHDLEGSLERDLRIRGAVRMGDLAVHRPTGDLLVFLDGRVTRYAADPWPQATAVVRVESSIFLAVSARLAVFDDGRLAICQAGLQPVVLYGADGSVEGDLMLPETAAPMALDVDSLGRLNVFVTAPESATPQDPFLLLFDADGNPIGARLRADVGAAQPRWPNPDSWPLGLDFADGRAAFSTWDSSDVLEVHSLSADSASQRVLVGGRADGPYWPRASIDPEQPAVAVGSDAMAVANTADGGLLVLDGNQERLVQFDLEGNGTVVGVAPAQAMDVAAGVDGAAYVSTATNRLLRIETTGHVTPTWEVECNCKHGGRLAVAGTVLYVSQPLQQRLAALDLGSRAVLRYVELPDAVGLWPSDIVVGRSGRLFTGDIILSQVQSWKTPAAPDIIWQAGLLAGPRRLAAARLSDGSDVIGTYMADGYVELHAATDGNLLSRWKPRLTDGSSPAVADLAVAPDGRVFIADKKARALQVFAPSDEPTPTPEAEVPPTPTPSDRSCDVSGDKVAGPPRIVLGETAQVTLTLAAECPDQARIIGADIVLVMDVSGSMAGAKLAAAQEAARNFVQLLDVRYHRVGVVSFSNEAKLLSGLSVDVGSVMVAIDDLNAEGGTNITGGLTVADRHLVEAGRSEALPVIVLLSDGRHNAGSSGSAVARDARNRGVQIYAIGLGSAADEETLKDIAGRPDRYYYAPTPDELFPIYEEILRQVLSSLAGNLIIDDEMADDIDYVAGSAYPPALSQANRLRWGRSLLPSSGITLTYDILPGRPGLLPTNRQAVAEYNDGDGVRRQFEFPVPEIEVITPTPTPTHTPTPTPTATPVPKPAFLPILYKHHCLPGTAHADIVLLIDTSSSMAGTKIAQAKSAAATFVRLLDLPRDQAAVIGFNSSPLVASPLTDDREALLRAVDGLTTRTGTMIDKALWVAAEIISRGPQRRPDNVAVVVLLSDGAHNGDPAEVLIAGEAVSRAGALVFAIGLGTDADVALLRSVADPGRYFFAPDGSALEEIYRSIAVKIPCR